MPVRAVLSAQTMGNGGEVIETFSLTYNGLPEAIRAVVDFLGMEVSRARTLALRAMHDPRRGEAAPVTNSIVRVHAEF